MSVHNEVRKSSSLFSDICGDHGIKSSYAFGSLVIDQSNPQRSDIDLLVEMEDMDPLEKEGKLLSLWDKLEDFFQRKVDPPTQKSLKNPLLLENIGKTRILSCDSKGKEVFI